MPSVVYAMAIRLSVRAWV